MKRHVHPVLSALLAAALVGAASLPTFAPQSRAATPAPSRYVGEETRDIKALSKVEVEGLLSGSGMGYAKAAELNGYPGPAHVLELAGELRLSSEQRSLTVATHSTMERKAVTLGKDLVDAERELDLLFADRSATAAGLTEVLTRIGSLQARLRDAHLQAHLEQARILTSEQNARYAGLRGYSNDQQPRRHHGHGLASDGPALNGPSSAGPASIDPAPDGPASSGSRH